MEIDCGSKSDLISERDMIEKIGESDESDGRSGSDEIGSCIL